MTQSFLKPDETALQAASALAIAARYHNQPDALIEMLHDVQAELGFVPDAVLPALAQALNLSRAEVYGVVSFYHDFRRQPAGRHVIKVCRAEACQSRNGRALLAALENSLNLRVGETSADGRVTLEAVYCLGLCATAPALMIDQQPKGRVTAEQLPELLAEISS